MRHAKNFVVLGVLLACPAGAQERAGEATQPDIPVAEVAKSGPPLLALDAVSTLTLTGAAKSSAQCQFVAVKDQAFSRAIQVKSPSLPASENDVRLVAPLTGSVQKGDVLVARFWMRGQALRAPITGRPNVGVALENTTGQSVGEVYRGTVPGLSTWREFRLALQASQDGGAGQVYLALRLGVVPQQVEIGALSLVNLKKSVTFASLNYFRNLNRGDRNPSAPYTASEQSPDAPWRRAAHARIEALRKGDLRLTITRGGRPVSGAQVRVAMKRHAFHWGSATGSEMTGGVGPDADKYRAILQSWFNMAAPENDLKWHKWNGSRTRQSIDWLRERRFHIHGHTLMWGYWGYIQGKERAIAAQLTKDSPAMQQLLLQHIRDVVSTHRERVQAWDVLNEPYTQNTVMGALGDKAVIEWFQAARQADPDAQLYLNEFNVLEDSNPGQADALEKTLKYLLENKAPLDGIGLQSHFGSPVSLARIVAILDRFGKLNKPIAITEFDLRGRNEKLQADWTRDFLTAAFSHPSVHSINLWGFWEKKHWIPEAALFRADWSIKPNGQAVRDLLLKEWWTNAQGASDAQGKYFVRGFLGEYEVTVSVNGQTKTMPLQLTKTGASVFVAMDSK